MEDLAQKVAEKAGITPEQAKIAVETIMQYVEGRVAPLIDAKVEASLKDFSVTLKGQVHEALTGKVLTSFAEKVGDFAEGAKDKLEDFAEGAKERLGSIASATKSFFGFGGKKEEPKKEESKEEATTVTPEKKEEDKK